MQFNIIKLKIPNNKGLMLATEIYKPNKNEKMPVVFLFHGFTGYKEENNLIDLAQKLSSLGIVTVQFTASGFGDSQGSLEKDYRFSNYRSDAEVVYEYITNLEYLDISRVGVFGHSMGGKLAVLFCADHPEIKALCVLSAPVNFFSVSLSSTHDSWKKSGYYEKVSGRDGKTIRVPYSYLLDADNKKNNVLKAAEIITRPKTLVIAGKVDETVSWKDTEKIYNTLKCPKELLLFDDMGHDYKKDISMIVKVHAPIIEFFKNSL